MAPFESTAKPSLPELSPGPLHAAGWQVDKRDGARGTGHAPRVDHRGVVVASVGSAAVQPSMYRGNLLAGRCYSDVVLSATNPHKNSRASVVHANDTIL
jgi:hypothetical protein